MTLRVLRYEVFCALPEEREFRRAQAERELDTLVAPDVQAAVTWQETVDQVSGFTRISWAIRMDDDELLQPLDD